MNNTAITDDTVLLILDLEFAMILKLDLLDFSYNIAIVTGWNDFTLQITRQYTDAM